MPLMCCVYGLNFLDSAEKALLVTDCGSSCRIDADALFAETTLSYASVMGIQADIHLKGDNYQWLAVCSTSVGALALKTIVNVMAI